MMLMVGLKESVVKNEKLEDQVSKHANYAILDKKKHRNTEGILKRN